MAERSAKLKLGGFVAGGLAAIAGLTVLFGGAPSFFNDRARYTVTFDEAPNITAGTPVRKSGVRIGQVSDISLDEDTGQVRVTIRVEKKYALRKSEEATIFRGILSGDSSLDFVPKTGPNNQAISTRGEAYAPDDTIDGVTPFNPNRLLNQASGALPNAQESMARMLASVQRFEAAVPKVERAFDEIAGFARSGRELLPEIRKTNEKAQELLAANDQPDDGQGGLKAMLAEVREFVKAARPLVEDIRRIVKANEADINGTLKAVRGTAEGLSDVLNPDNRKAIGGLIKNLETASDDLTKTIRLAAIILDQGDKTIKAINARLAQAEKTLNSAEGAFRNVELATKPIAENAEPVMKNIAAASDQLAKALAEVRQTLAVVNRADGTLQKALGDPALYNNLNEAAASLGRTLIRAEKVALDLQVFADKIARRPESLGVGGAVRPNTGLKESPTAPLPVQPLPPISPSFRPPN